MISKTPFVVVDLETTGLEPRLDRIMEIAAVRVLNGEIVDEWDTLVNPGVYVPQESTAISGITTEMVNQAPKFELVAADFLRFLGEDSIFVAHNADFDWTFMNTHLERFGMPLLQNPYLCTFKLAKQVHPNLARYSLGALAHFFDIELPQAHRAVHDARATAQLFSKFMKVLQDGGLKEVHAIPSLQNLPKKTKELSNGQVSLF